MTTQYFSFGGTSLFWDEAYKGTPPWDVGHPQSAFEGLIKSREIKPGRTLDIGCGRGDNAIMLAMSGCDVTGIDIAKSAISDAKEKAMEKRVKVNFVVGDILQMDRLFRKDEFDIIIDSGLFHTMTDEERPIFAQQVHRVLKKDGKYFMLCFSDKEPGGYGPRRVSKAEIENTFTPLFNIMYIKDATFDSHRGPGNTKAYLLSAVRN
ncbi:class I SAM-dependent methyltransferase [Methanosarcina sp. T3]|uniref:class I SAM-dependent methyltransferase n=1 Tax=Methanosarcina sp. T3 TaxID=3439062 RepID=UPI003F85C2B6